MKIWVDYQLDYTELVLNNHFNLNWKFESMSNQGGQGGGGGDISPSEILGRIFASFPRFLHPYLYPEVNNLNVLFSGVWYKDEQSACHSGTRYLQQGTLKPIYFPTFEGKANFILVHHNLSLL